MKYHQASILNKSGVTGAVSLTVVWLLDKRDSLFFKQLAGSVDVWDGNANVPCKTAGRQTLTD